ncbi:MAG: winged helix-turn-helix transcriptional regulator [Thermococcus sp.]|nr:winged helix-turn-helix transcriptional regulator [Thermococcus sp.]
MGYETIDINDERAKELAQILMNEKAIAILHLIEDTPMSISEISKELNLPISTVSYHIDKMMRVGLVEVAGKKYGKRLQEVKLYRASNRPILLIPRKSIQKVHKKTFSLERLHVISLGLAGLVSLLVYKTSSALLKTPSAKEGSNVTYAASHVPNATTSSPYRIMTTTNTSTKTAVETAAKPTTSQITTFPVSSNSPIGWEPLLLAVLAFIITVVLTYYLLKRRG